MPMQPVLQTRHHIRAATVIVTPARPGLRAWLRRWTTPHHIAGDRRRTHDLQCSGRGCLPFERALASFEKLSGNHSVNSPSLRFGLAFSDKHARLGLRCILNFHVACAITLVRVRILRTDNRR